MGARWSAHFDSLRSTLIDLVSVALLAFPKPSLKVVADEPDQVREVPLQNAGYEEADSRMRHV